LIYMCQLAAYVGDRPIAPLLLNALKYQEPYFGAHATGIGVLKRDMIDVVKAPGHVAHVKKVTDIERLNGTCAMAHSRYNAPAKEDARYNTVGMAHPFLSDDGRLALMHNGGIANYKTHWERLRDSHEFRSYSPEVDAITDSEVAVHMLADEVAGGKSVGDALKSIAAECTGSFLLGAISVEEPDTVYIANWHQPCYVAVGDDEAMFVSSRAGLRDVKGEMTSIFRPPKNSLIKLTRGGAEISVLDKDRKVPDLRLDMNLLAERFEDVLREKGRRDFREMWYDLNPDGWAEAYGLPVDDWNAMRKAGVSVVNSYIDVVDMLKHEFRVVESVDPRVEGGVAETPRFSYVLA
jgi:glucosamine 6-phosphate synthetase-like amidotransferase/phosphosugar isomerase protein